MAEKTLVTLTNMCMVCDGKKVLVQDRVDTRWGGIAFPGGHVEQGESFTDSVIREVWEETGLTVINPRLCGVKDWCDESGRYIILFYKADKFTGELRSSEEGEVYWTEISDIDKSRFACDMDKMIDVFTNDEISEFFYDRQGDEWNIRLQ